MWGGALVVGLVAVLAAVPLPAGPARAQGMRPPPRIATQPPFPLDDPQAVAEGAKKFQASYCHGREGRVSRAPSLRGKTYDPLFLYGRIAHGAPPMPAFQTLLPPEDIWRLVAYILSLSTVKDDQP
jgi:mono/diheme cytochrome c family protein